MDPDQLMADYQLLGDSFSYGYGGPPSSGQPPGSLPVQNGYPPGTTMGAGGQTFSRRHVDWSVKMSETSLTSHVFEADIRRLFYHQLTPGHHPPSRCAPPDSKSGLHSQYPFGPGSQSSMTSLSGQYPGICDYSRPGLAQGHMAIGPPPSQPPGSIGYSARLMSSFDQRVPPGLSNRPSSHSMSGHRNYIGYSSSSPAAGYGPSTSDPWTQQPRPPYGSYPSFPGNQYYMNGRSFYPSASQGPQTSHLSGDLYPSPSSFGPQPTTRRGHTTSNPRSQTTLPQPTHPFTPSPTPGSVSTSKFPQQYQYGHGAPFTDTPQSRMSPYGVGLGPSPGAQVNQQNSSLRSPQTPSASSVESPLNSQFSGYDNQFSSNDSFNASSGDQLHSATILPSMGSIQKSSCISKGYSSSSKCSTDSGYSAPGSVGSSNGSTSCMVAAATVNGYSSISSESTINDSSQSSCISSGHSMNPGPVSITGGEAVPNLSSVYTEQEIDLPSINYQAVDEGYSTNEGKEKKRKEKSSSNKERKKKNRDLAKQAEIADRIAQGLPLSNCPCPPFDVPVPNLTHPFMLSFTPDMTNSYMGCHLESHVPTPVIPSIMQGSSTSYTSHIPLTSNDQIVSNQQNLPPTDPSPMHQNQPNQISSHQNNADGGPQVLESHCPELAELEDDLKILAESSVLCTNQTTDGGDASATVTDQTIYSRDDTTIRNELHSLEDNEKSATCEEVVMLDSTNSVGVSTQADREEYQTTETSDSQKVQEYSQCTSVTDYCKREFETSTKKRTKKVPTREKESSKVQKTPKTKSPKTNRERHHQEVAAPNNDTKFFKNRPHQLTQEIELDKMVKETGKSRKRKQAADVKASHDEYEFQEESPTEPAKKRGKKIQQTHSSKSTKKASEKTIIVTSVTLPIIVPQPVPQTVKSSKPSTKITKVVQPNLLTAPLTSEIETLDKPKKPIEIERIGKKETKSQASKASKQTDLKKEYCTPKESSETLSISPVPSEKSDPPKTNDHPTPQPKNSTKGQSSAGLNKKGVAKETTGAGGTNAPRRRSSDKKALTIKEGLMRTGDFVMSVEELNNELPMIWRIEGKSLLQRFEPSQQEGLTIYTNTSSYSAWNPTVKQKFRGVDVRIMGCSRTKITVEKLGLTKVNPSANLNSDASIEKTRPPVVDESAIYQYQENFEVYIQTLISQSLDPNFIAEIIKEKDDYFLSNVQAIDDACSEKKARFCSKVKWDANIQRCMETFPAFSVAALKNEHDLRCRLCNDNWSSFMFSFSGDPYDPQTLDHREPLDVKQTKHAACDSCRDRVVLFSRLHHCKYNFFLQCQKKVAVMRSQDETKESHVLLEECLQDNNWIQMLYDDLQDIWNRIR